MPAILGRYGPGSFRPFHRVAERRRPVALARHFRDAEALSIAQIAERLGRTPATGKAYFWCCGQFGGECHLGRRMTMPVQQR